VRTCKRCGYEYVSEKTAPIGHSIKEVSSPPTCSREGSTLYYCGCGYSYFSNILPPIEHSLKASAVDPTCTEQGYTHYSCSQCDYSFNSDFIAPLGHSFTKTSVLPTATRAGYTKYSCECSYYYLGDYVYYSDILETAYTPNTQILQNGLDVSRWNHQIDPLSGEYLPLDWSGIKAQGYDFVILKAGSTKSGLEPTFEPDYEGAKAAGLEVGAYFYTYSNTIEGISNDADMLLRFLEGKQFEYPIYLDLEDPSLSTLGKNYLSRMCTTFLETLQRNGYYAGLYTNHTWLTTLLDTARMVSLFDIWYARYPGTEAPTWNEEKYGKQLGMWQYTQSGSIEGIEGEFDLNYSYKNYSSIMKKWGLNGYGK
jgi:GH25 family lysozyme M1 (1,4-beta-N-acetylmuramidase)